MATFTVTATFTGGATPGGGTIRVTALNGAKTVSQQTGGTGGTTSTTSMSFDQSVTVAATGSVIYGAASNFSNNTAYTADSATTFTDNVSFTSGDRTGTFRSTNATSATGAQTFGATAPTAVAGSVSLAEILAATTIAEDPSTNSAVTTVTSGSSVTSPSITPPAGSLLVVRVAAVAGTGPATATITDNSGLGLNWKALKQEGASGAGANYAGIFIADVPAEPQYRKLFSRNWTRHFKHPVPASVSTAVPIPVIQSTGPVQVQSLTGPLTATLPNPTGSGNTLVACITTNGTVANPAVSSITLGGVADNWQNAFSDPGNIQYGGMIWYDPNAASGQTSVVLTCSGGSGVSADIYLSVFEVYGILAFDQGTHGDSSTAVTTFSSGTTAQLSQMNEIAFGVEMNSVLVAQFSGAGPWQTISTGAGQFDQTAGYQQITSGGTASIFGSLGGGGIYVAVVATFFPTTAPSNVNVAGPVASVNVSGQADNSVQLFQTFNPQFAAPSVLPNSLRFNAEYVALRQQYSTALPDVFVPGSTANVNVASSGATTDFIDGTGATASVGVAAPAGSILITQNFNQQYPFKTVLPPAIGFNPSFQALRVQSPSMAVFVPPAPVNIAGVTANVNVSGQADNSVTETISGTTSAVSVTAQPGQIQIFQIENPPFPDSPILPASLRFNPAYTGLRPQYNTGFPGVFETGTTGTVNVSGQADNTVTESVPGVTGQVNVSAPVGSFTITQVFNPQTPFTAILPASLKFVPSLEVLRAQYNTGTPIPLGGVSGGVANVTVSGQVDNNVNQALAGAVANVNAVAQAGSLTITTSTPPQYPFSPILASQLRFNPAYSGLRPQYNTTLPDVFVTGSAGSVTVSGQTDNIIVETITGSTATINVASSGAVTEVISGTSANISVTAIAGSLSVVVSGSTGLVNATANPGSAGSGGKNITGVTATVNVTAIAGAFQLTVFDRNWWRVYKQYPVAPVW